MIDSKRMTENKRDIKPDIYAHVKTTNVINDVRPVGESKELVCNGFDELDRRSLGFSVAILLLNVGYEQ